MQTKHLGTLGRVGQPILVFGGPYSNLQATRALRQVADRLGIPPAHVICTGDVVAYCAEPAETIAEVRAWGCHVIQGNCEEQLAAGAEDCGCGFDAGSACDVLAKGWFPFANARVSRDDRLWMGGLPHRLAFSVAGITAHVLHGGTSSISRFVFASEPNVIEAEAAPLDSDLIIAGHAGIPFITRFGGVGDGSRVWFNAGVIGMPANDGTAETWYGLITPTTKGVELSTHRLTYDARPTVAAMRRYGYADGYAQALETGLWPSLCVLPPMEQAATGQKLSPETLVLKGDARSCPVPVVA
jgi:predicted phosphodiesterase